MDIRDKVEQAKLAGYQLNEGQRGLGEEKEKLSSLEEKAKHIFCSVRLEHTTRRRTGLHLARFGEMLHSLDSVTLPHSGDVWW